MILPELRRVDPGYAGRLAGLWAETFRQAYGHMHSVENINAYCDRNFTVGAAEAALADSGVVCKVAFSGEIALGFYLVRNDECPLPLDGCSSELRQIYVLRSEYGSGIGELLFNDALQCLCGADREWIWLVVADLNRRARRFYLRRSFKPLGAGPVIELGSDRLSSTILYRRIQDKLGSE